MDDTSPHQCGGGFCNWWCSRLPGFVLYSNFSVSHLPFVEYLGCTTISNSGLPHLQIRSRMASLDGIVPSTNGMTISSTGIVNVFMSMEHQAIVWCNEFVVKVSFSSLPGLIACPSSGTVHLLYGNKSSLDR